MCGRSRFLADLANRDKVTQVNPGKTNRTDGAFQLFKDGKVGMVMGFSPLAAQLDAEGKVSYGVAEMPTSIDKPVTLGVEDYLMAFKKKDNREAVKQFLDLYYQPENITRWITAEGFLPVTTVRPRADGRQSEAEAVPRRPAQRPAGADDRSRLGPGQARRPAEHRPRGAAGRQPEAGPRPAPEERRGCGGRALTALDTTRLGRWGPSPTASCGSHRHLTSPRAPGRRRGAGHWQALLWLGPSLALIAAVVVYPVVALVRASFGRYSITGLHQGSAGLHNYARLLEQDALPAVLANTAVWVAVIVGATIVLSLGLGQFLNASFPGRRLVRWALIVPWAASLIMTSKLFVWIYDYYFGILNHLLVSLHVIARPVDWLGDDATVMAAMIAVGIFVSLPFTTYVVLAGLVGHSPRGLRGGARRRRLRRGAPTGR